MKYTAVMVIYKQAVEESKTYRSLMTSLKSGENLPHEFELIIYDNSPKKQEIPVDDTGVVSQYIHDSRNLGITTAYNFAWSHAKKSKSDWLLLLDHDTQLTVDYIQTIMNLPKLSEDVVAVAPKIWSHGSMISPVYSRFLRPLKEEPPKAGLQEEPVMAINSGSLIRVEFINQLGGFNESFQLDYLDHWLFFEIYAHQKKVWIVDVRLNHELSVMDYSQVSLKRYKSILDAEIYFFQNYKIELYPTYKKQLIKRFLKQALLVKNKKIALYTLNKLLNRKRG